MQMACLQGMLAGQAGAVKAGVQDMASQTAGLMPADLAALVADAGSAALLQVGAPSPAAPPWPLVHHSCGPQTNHSN